ncbi:hypothetical protein C900_02467 [Fulvivirga imtechensis AK7]|uniref:LVIVD repeat protein n=1 Tax=Fulvivirga imtechensis AK7 TaxID=1237149 RepID=L8JWF6_9BACT|nr:hypothetical protein [Fulvivirga imtechensis]ELR71552.1 hypothetical protein C900_02467 [Fulvivirga imtechensis AK7]
MKSISPGRKSSGVNRSLTILLLIMALVSCLLVGCTDKCNVKNTYTYFEPVYTPLAEIRAAVTTLPAQEISQAGKMFYNNGFLFINEPNQGVHVIDNRDPSQPQNITFINIPGAFDLAVKGHILFSDSYVDLVAIDITDVHNAKEVGRLKDLFASYNSYGFYATAELGVVTGWKEVEQVNLYESDCEASSDWHLYETGIAVDNNMRFEANLAVSPGASGIGGSMARFALGQGHLYAIDATDLYPIDVSNATDMHPTEKVLVDWGIETLFPIGDKLFIGAQNGMFIMDISDPLHPVQVSNYRHVTSCDPVVVDGNYAYVTLRSGTECQGFTNQLEVIDISDISSPQLLHVYEMYNPHGLGKDGDVLFICDGTEGLKIYNAARVDAIAQNLLAHYKNIRAFDVIPFNNVAMMIGDDGLYQYDYSDISNIKFLSHIKISTDAD